MPLRTTHLPGVLAALLAAALTAPAAAAAQGYPLTGAPVPLDGVRPRAMPGALVADDAPVAVHGPPGTSLAALVAVRDAAAHTLNTLDRALHFPLPAPDGGAGGGPELDVYLVPPGAQPDALARCTIDALEYGAPWDRASAFVTVRADARGEALDRALAEAVAEAVLLGIDARSEHAWRLAVAAALAERITGLAPQASAVARFQRDPGAALLAATDDDAARGAGTFVDYVVAHYDAPDLALLRGLVAMPVAPTPTDADAPVLAPWPDVFDAMRRLFRDEPGGFEGVFARYSVARALIGTEGDTTPLYGWIDDARLLPDTLASLDYATGLPAFLTPGTPTDETGTAYVRVRTHGAPADAGLHVWFHGVPWRSWRVTAALLDASGREAGRAPSSDVVAGEWSARIEQLAGVDEVLLVVNDFGTNHFSTHNPPDRNGLFQLHVARAGGPEAR